MGRLRKHKAQTLWNAIQYIASTVCQWAQLPKYFPPFTTVQYYFYRMRDNGLLDAVNAVLVAWVRVAEGRSPHPSGGIIETLGCLPMCGHVTIRVVTFGYSTD